MIDISKDNLQVQDFAFNTSIFEYDIRSAGLSILAASGALPAEKVEELSKLDKTNRVVTIGLMMRDDPQLSKIVTKGLQDARKQFIIQNKVEDGDIIMVKRDAIFCTKRCQQLEFGGVQFRIKTKWRSYMRLDRIEFLFQDINRYQILGLGTTATDYHRDGWVKTLLTIMQKISDADRSAYTYTMNFIAKYRDDRLDERFYHMFRSNPTQVSNEYNYQHVIVPLIQIMIGM